MALSLTGAMFRPRTVATLVGLAVLSLAVVESAWVPVGEPTFELMAGNVHRLRFVRNVRTALITLAASSPNPQMRPTLRL